VTAYLIAASPVQVSMLVDGQGGGFYSPRPPFFPSDARVRLGLGRQSSQSSRIVQQDCSVLGGDGGPPGGGSIKQASPND